METIYKYPIAINDEQEIEMPAQAKLMTVQMQNGQPYLWAIVDTEKPKCQRKIRIYGTGHPMKGASGTGRYISTFQMNGGALVFHAFEA